MRDEPEPDMLNIDALRRATVALALEMPASVHRWYAPRVHAVLDEMERLRSILERARPVLDAASEWRETFHVPGIETIHEVNEDSLRDAVDAVRCMACHGMPGSPECGA